MNETGACGAIVTNRQNSFLYLRQSENNGFTRGLMIDLGVFLLSKQCIDRKWFYKLTYTLTHFLHLHILSDGYIVYFLKHVLKKNHCIHSVSIFFCSMETTHLILHQGVCSYDEEFYIIDWLLTIVFLILLLVGSFFYSKLLIYRNRLSLNSAIGSNIFFIINDFSSVFVKDF